MNLPSFPAPHEEPPASFTVQDIALAQEVQRTASAPASPAPPAGIDIAALTVPRHAVGGDFHQILSQSNGPLNGQRQRRQRQGGHRIGLAVGDVSGKGLAASLMATSIGHLLPWLAPLKNPLRALRALNQELLERTPLESYASMVLAEADTDTGDLRVWSAGHPPALLWQARSRRVEILSGGNLPLGCFGHWQGQAQRRSWAEGDILVLYSDGLIEARNAMGEPFGIDGVAAALQQHCGGSGAAAGADSPAAIAQALLDAARAWGPVNDDVTLLACRRTAAPPASRSIRCFADGRRSARKYNEPDRRRRGPQPAAKENDDGDDEGDGPQSSGPGGVRAAGVAGHSDPRAGAGRGARSRRDLRRLPHGPARGRGRAAAEAGGHRSRP